MSSGQHVSQIGDRIRTAYVRAGFNRSRFARAIDVSYGTIINWEKGLKMPSGDSLDAIANVLGTSVDWILHGDAEGAAMARKHALQPAYQKKADAAFQQFLQEESTLCAMLTEDDLEEIREIRFRAGAPSGAAFYRFLAMARLEHRAGKDLVEALDAEDITPEYKPGDSLTLDASKRLPRQHRVKERKKA